MIDLVFTDGSVVALVLSAVPLFDADGRVRGSVIAGADVTMLKKAEDALRKAHGELELRVDERTAQLSEAYDALHHEMEERNKTEAQLRQAQKMEALGTLTGGIAHDFNNILAVIVGFTDIVRGHVPKKSQDAQGLDRVMEAGLRGRELIRQMLAFSRKTDQDKKPVQLSSIIRETMKLLRASIPTTVSIKVDIKSEPGVVLADLVQVQQVLMNLCTNAAYAMREKGGTLNVELSDLSVEQSNGNSHPLKPGNYARLVVRDTGEGIPEDVMDKIFDPFFTTKKLGEGTGLGLSVVHGIVRQHDGHITVESLPGKGSTFSVYLPRIAEASSSAEAAAEGAMPTGHEHILFIDDEEMLVEVGQELLEELGYRITASTDSARALALFRADPSRFDLVVTDQTMPNLTGIELAKEIIALKPDTPVILCTGFSHLVNADTARAAGIRAFAMKPLTKREIAKTIRQVLDE
jgi:signal transduction histidine kinase/ActR/RegA family two-component response regulator